MSFSLQSPGTEINEMIQKSFQRNFLNQSPGEVKSWEFISKICKFDVKAELFIRPKMNVRVYSGAEERNRNKDISYDIKKSALHLQLKNGRN